MTGNIFNISDNIVYIGVDDNTLDLFENQYKVPDGMCYNSYLIKGDKTAVVDTTDGRTGEEWLSNLRKALGDRQPDYLIVEHMEPDHSSLISTFMEIYPEAALVMSAVAAKMLPLYVDPMPANAKIITMKEGDTLDLGGMTLTFYMAPMVHWPEVMMIYCTEEKTLFSADAFGTFGIMGTLREEWAKEARRYYYNIVGKFGPQVKNVLKKLSSLDIETICPLHGPVLSGNLSEYISHYDDWSSYRKETDGVFIASASIHGNTLNAANYLAEKLRAKGVNTYVADLTHDDLSAMLAEAFRYPKAVFCASSYDAGLFTPMYNFLHMLEIKGYRDRKVALVENGSWAPTAGKLMRTIFSEMKDIEVLPNTVTIRGAFKQSDHAALDQLAEILK